MNRNGPKKQLYSKRFYSFFVFKSSVKGCAASEFVYESEWAEETAVLKAFLFLLRIQEVPGSILDTYQIFVSPTCTY